MVQVVKQSQTWDNVIVNLMQNVQSRVQERGRSRAVTTYLRGSRSETCSIKCGKITEGWIEEREEDRKCGQRKMEKCKRSSPSARIKC